MSLSGIWISLAIVVSLKSASCVKYIACTLLQYAKNLLMRKSFSDCEIHSHSSTKLRYEIATDIIKG